MEIISFLKVLTCPNKENKVVDGDSDLLLRKSFSVRVFETRAAGSEPGQENLSVVHRLEDGFLQNKLKNRVNNWTFSKLLSTILKNKI